MPLMAAWRRFPEGRIGPTRIGRRRSSPASCPGTRESGGLKLAGVTFEWDPRKAAANFKKHGVAFEDASSVFFDPLAMTYPDPDDSLDEHRSEEHTSELQSLRHLVCRLLLDKKQLLP